MSDIFISYSKADRPLAMTLSAFLDAEGWSVWWDKSLGAADLYRDEIMKQLAAARAVITIWTPNSIKSDWVRAEAGAAKAQGKLIPVKSADVTYGDIPLPFGEMHTENVGSTDLIRAAVVAQLAKPAAEPSALTLLGKGLKWELLTWWGIIGGAITLFVAISTTLKLADWASWLVEHWKALSHAFWVWAFGWLGIHVPAVWTPVLSFLLFGSLLTIGQAIKYNRSINNESTVDKNQGKAFRLMSWCTLLFVICAMISEVIWLKVVDMIIEEYPMFRTLLDTSYDYYPSGYILLVSVLLSIPLIVPVAILARQRLHATVAITLMLVFSITIFSTFFRTTEPSPGDSYEFAAVTTGLTMMMVLPPVLLSVAPAKAISRRLIFLAIGLLLLIALNELSKLGLDLTAPKVQG
jgi:hypothetical protein